MGKGRHFIILSIGQHFGVAGRGQIADKKTGQRAEGGRIRQDIKPWVIYLPRVSSEESFETTSEGIAVFTPKTIRLLAVQNLRRHVTIFIALGSLDCPY